MRHNLLRTVLLIIGTTYALLGQGTRASATNAAPEITATAWLNSAPVRLADLKGHVALVEFWTFGCYNCRNVEPHVQEWHRKYGGAGLIVVGVHTPETAYERDIENVKRYVQDHHIAYPVAIDGDFVIWRSYSNTAWPAWYLIRGRLAIATDCRPARRRDRRPGARSLVRPASGGARCSLR